MQNSPARFVVEVGTVIDDTYIIEAMIGRGGMGAVYLATHRRLQGKKVAIKTLHADIVGEEESLARFKREADIASQLDHPNIVKVENYNVLPDGTPYIVYEYLNGESLAARIAKGAMPMESTFSILRQIGSALGAAHRAGIVHRDLKPQNIFLVPSEQDGHATELAKVLDFGISKMRNSTTVKTQEQTLLGTPQYMAPEQATGQHASLDQRTDIFALGAILYEMVSGKPAFRGENIPEVVFKVVYEEPKPLAEIAPQVADAVVSVIKKAMAKAPNDRYSTVSELVEAMTGTPLSLVRKPRVSGAQDNPNDAFAQTVDSQSQAPKIPTTNNGIPKPVDDFSSASTVAADSIPAVVTPKPAPSRKPPVLLIVAAVVIAIAGAAAMYFAIRKKHEPRIETAKVEPTPTKVEAPAIDAALAPVVVPDAAQIVEAPKPDAGAPKPEIKKPVAATVAVAEDANEDPTIDDRLKEAEVAYRAGEFDKAEHIANFIITGNVGGKGQVAHAHVIHGLVMCSSAHNNQSAANTDARQIKAFPKFRAKLVSGCRAMNIELSAD